MVDLGGWAERQRKSRGSGRIFLVVAEEEDPRSLSQNAYLWTMVRQIGTHLDGDFELDAEMAVSAEVDGGR